MHVYRLAHIGSVCMGNMADFQSAVRTCSIHHLKELVIYCFTCGTPICFQCSREEHSSHECDAISNAARDTRAKIPEQCHGFQKGVLRKLRGNKKYIDWLVKESKENEEKDDAKIDNIQTEIINIVQSLFHKERGDIVKDRKEVAFLKKELVDSFYTDVEKRIGDMAKYQTIYSDFDVLEMNKELLDKTKECEETHGDHSITKRYRGVQEKLTDRQNRDIERLLRQICSSISPMGGTFPFLFTFNTKYLHFQCIPLRRT